MVGVACRSLCRTNRGIRAVLRLDTILDERGIFSWRKSRIGLRAALGYKHSNPTITAGAIHSAP